MNPFGWGDPSNPRCSVSFFWRTHRPKSLFNLPWRKAISGQCLFNVRVRPPKVFKSRIGPQIHECLLIRQGAQERRAIDNLIFATEQRKAEVSRAFFNFQARFLTIERCHIDWLEGKDGWIWKSQQHYHQVGSFARKTFLLWGRARKNAVRNCILVEPDWTRKIPLGLRGWVNLPNHGRWNK